MGRAAGSLSGPPFSKLPRDQGSETVLFTRTDNDTFEQNPDVALVSLDFTVEFYQLGIWDPQMQRHDPRLVGDWK